MIKIRGTGLNHIYFDNSNLDFSNVALGYIIRAIGHGLRVAYVDVTGKSTRLTNFLENLCLNRIFNKNFVRLHIETFKFKKDKISKSILPMVEFYTIDKNMFYKSLNDFDLVIFDNVSFEFLSEFKILNLIEEKKISNEFIFNFNVKKDFDGIKANFDLITEYKVLKGSSFKYSKNVFNILGNGKGKTLFALGYLFRNFIEKQDVKLISFDKGDRIYGEILFFEALKKWTKQNNLYGKFDFVMTGSKRFNGREFRYDINELDKKEANEAVMLLKTALKKQTPVLADELNTAIEEKIVNLNDILDIVKNVDNELVLTGEKSPKELIDVSNKVVEAICDKSYIKEFGYKQGIDF